MPYAMPGTDVGGVRFRAHDGKHVGGHGGRAASRAAVLILHGIALKLHGILRSAASPRRGQHCLLKS
eukprot:3021416-Rhodomonas_salina.1